MNNFKFIFSLFFLISSPFVIGGEWNCKYYANGISEVKIFKSDKSKVQLQHRNQQSKSLKNKFSKLLNFDHVIDLNAGDSFEEAIFEGEVGVIEFTKNKKRFSIDLEKLNISVLDLRSGYNVLETSINCLYK